MDIAHPQSLQTDPKIQNVRGYWAGSEDKGISQQTVIQNIFSKFLSKTTEIQKIHFAEETSFSTSFLSDSGMIIFYPSQQLAQGCINCGILVSGIRARGVSSEHMENMEMFSCSPTKVCSDSQRT